ncbi:unannotated protein [freshwater metagenome]|uniref:Unannotated protein n=1 Tax=freshwater metagenome TaxID=449393 RepID=A0A6J7IIF4_9ZZZZ|nr:hypothetical protein [Actinomycetota bacterium]
MRQAALALASAVLLAGPTVIAFFSGGYFDTPRLWGLALAWVLVLIAALCAPRPLPRALPGRLVLGGMAALTASTAISIAWAPLSGAALDDVQRLLLYLGALIAAIALLRRDRMARAIEPALGFGACLVVAYGVAGRLLPGVLQPDVSLRAGGRLDQPLTYWNGMGALAAIGVVLCVHLGADRTRSARLRALAIAACAPLSAGLYLSYSRGAIAGLVVGLLVILALDPTRSALRALAVAAGVGAAGVLACAPFDGVADLTGSLGHRERQGLVALALLIGVMLVGAVAAVWLTRSDARRPEAADASRLPGARLLPAAAATAFVAALCVVVIGGLTERAGDAARTDLQSAGRLTSLQSNRYEYWRVAAGAFADRPVQGLGSSGFRVRWLEERPIPEVVRNAHSLPLETAAELGLVGLLALLALLGGAGLAAMRALARRPGLSAGWVAACAVFLLHAFMDWGWQMPAVALPFVLLVGALAAVADEDLAASGETPDLAARTGEARAVAEPA